MFSLTPRIVTALPPTLPAPNTPSSHLRNHHLPSTTSVTTGRVELLIFLFGDGTSQFHLAVASPAWPTHRIRHLFRRSLTVTDKSNASDKPRWWFLWFLFSANPQPVSRNAHTKWLQVHAAVVPAARFYVEVAKAFAQHLGSIVM